jgi:hypothetical protein
MQSQQKMERISPNTTHNNHSILQAVMEQSKYTDAEADQILAARKAQNEENLKKAMIEMSKSQNIRDHINIPSQIKTGELDQKPEVHPNLKGYDHSLEQVRKKFTSEGPDSDGIEFGDLTSQDVL